MPLRSLALFTLLLSFQTVILAANNSEACLKKVFGEYCLGGSLQQLLRQRPHGMRSQENGERSAVVYPEGRERTYVMAYKGSIYKVLHTFDPANQVKLKELLGRLEAKYGAYRNLSQYPGYARTLAAKIGAIRRGEGELNYIWQSPDDNWSIELTWTRELGIAIAYLAKRLNQTQLEAMERGL